jgi:hypothetical protein
MTLTTTFFRTLALLIGDGGSPENFAPLATINTERGIQFQSQGVDVYQPDPNNPESVLKRSHRVTGISASISAAGSCSVGDITTLMAWYKSGAAKDIQLAAISPADSVTVLGHYALSMKLTAFNDKSDPPKGDDATFDCTLESDGDFNWIAGS